MLQVDVFNVEQEEVSLDLEYSQYDRSILDGVGAVELEQFGDVCVLWVVPSNWTALVRLLMMIWKRKCSSMGTICLA